jgi:hypothetical protein
VPRISEFYGTYVYMYSRDHMPPHFHAFYAQHEAEIAIATDHTLKGHLPRRALSLVRKWAKHYRAELETNWRLAREGYPLNRIPPLE